MTVDVLAAPGALSKGSIDSVIFLLIEVKANTQFLSHKGAFLRKRTLYYYYSTRSEPKPAR